MRCMEVVEVDVEPYSVSWKKIQTTLEYLIEKENFKYGGTKENIPVIVQIYFCILAVNHELPTH